MSMTKVEIYKYLLDNVNSEIEARVQKLKFIYAIDIVFVAFLCSVYTRQDVESKINLSSETHFIAFFFYMPFIFFFISFATVLSSRDSVLFCDKFFLCIENLLRKIKTAFCRSKNIIPNISRSICNSEDDLESFLQEQVKIKEKLLSRLAFLTTLSSIFCYLGASFVFLFVACMVGFI